MVVVITGTLFGVNLYGTVMLRQYFDQVWFLPPETMAYKYTVTNAKVTAYYPLCMIVCINLFIYISIYFFFSTQSGFPLGCINYLWC